MKLFVPFRQRNVQSCSCSTERSDSAYQLCVISVCLYAMLQIGKSRIYTWITKSQENNIFSLIKTGFQSFCAFCMIFFKFLCIMCHRHVDWKKFFFFQLRNCLYCNFIGNGFFNVCTRYSDDLIFTDHANCLLCH